MRKSNTTKRALIHLIDMALLYAQHAKNNADKFKYLHVGNIAYNELKKLKGAN